MTDNLNNEVQPNEAKAPEVTTEEVQAQPELAAQGQGSGPWTDDLASTFEDEGMRSQVDAFLRDKVQPYVTQLEQRSKPSEEMEIAGQLYSDLREDPGSTYLAITEELFGTEASTAIQAALAESFGIEEEGDTTGPGPNAEEADLDPRVARLLAKDEEREAREAYDNALAQVKAKDPELDVELFHPFVVSAEGDMASAYQGYKEWIGKAREHFGPQLSDEEVAAAAKAAQGPPVIGSDVRSPTTPPVQKRYSSMDQAIDDFLDEERSAPPVVGGT